MKLSDIPRRFLRRIGTLVLMAGALVFSATAVPAQPIVYPQSVYQGYHQAYRYHPSAAYRHSPRPRRTCPLVERRWVPRDVRYDRDGNVKQVRGRYVTVRQRVPC